MSEALKEKITNDLMVIFGNFRVGNLSIRQLEDKLLKTFEEQMNYDNC